ncbi:FHA domain-containing protein [Anoxynatronum sibiricum]|uniref:FHA domain-containing protein n=1 Tax=Anoxynatronum sibiricum TaxID=210623 RepID=A0ABU9VT01_9CLOT
MNQLTRCNNGHYYDASKHSGCPYCGVQSLDIDIQKTMAKRPTPPPAAGGKGAPAQEGRTMGVFHKKMGIDPVVGWFVCIEGADRGRDYRIVAEKNFVGRSNTMDICIEGDETISRENHTIVSYNPKDHKFRLYPGDGRGLVYLNDEELVMPAVLNPYDVIELGETRLMFLPFCGEAFTWKKKASSETEEP